MCAFTRLRFAILGLVALAAAVALLAGARPVAAAGADTDGARVRYHQCGTFDIGVPVTFCVDVEGQYRSTLTPSGNLRYEDNVTTCTTYVVGDDSSVECSHNRSNYLAKQGAPHVNQYVIDRTLEFAIGGNTFCSRFTYRFLLANDDVRYETTASSAC